MKFTSWLPALAGSALWLAGCLDDPQNAASGRMDHGAQGAQQATAPVFATGAIPPDPEFVASIRISPFKPNKPSVVDYTSRFPAPGFQGGSYSCVAWSLASILAFLEKKEEGWGISSQMRQFSPSYIYNQINNGQNNGSVTADALRLIQEQGADNLFFSPFNSFDYVTQPDDLAHLRASRYAGYSYSTLVTVDEIKSALASEWGVFFTFNVRPDFLNLNASNPVWNDASGSYLGYHAVAVVGYDDSKHAFKVVNSWGTIDWGIGGYGWIDYAMVDNWDALLFSFAVQNASNQRNWSASMNTRELGDVNKDGKRDLVGFGQDGVYVSLSNGSSFGSASLWLQDFGSDNGWDGITVKHVADVSGDGRADLVVYGFDEVWVATAATTGSKFNPPQAWSFDFGYFDGWMPGDHSRQVADMNGDGKADLVGFGDDGVWVALSNGSGFGAASRWTTQFGNNGGWGANTPRLAADMNGGGRADLVGFNSSGVQVALTSSTSNSVGTSKQATTQFRNGATWDANTVRLLADMTGDGKADLVGFGYDNTVVAVNNGSSSSVSFATGTNWTTTFGINDGFGSESVKLAGNVDGTSGADVVVTGETTVGVRASTGTSLGTSTKTWLSKNFAHNTNEWYAP